MSHKGDFKILIQVMLFITDTGYLKRNKTFALEKKQAIF